MQYMVAGGLTPEDYKRLAGPGDPRARRAGRASTITGLSGAAATATFEEVLVREQHGESRGHRPMVGSGVCVEEPVETPSRGWVGWISNSRLTADTSFLI